MRYQLLCYVTILDACDSLTSTAICSTIGSFVSHVFTSDIYACQDSFHLFPLRHPSTRLTLNLNASSTLDSSRSCLRFSTDDERAHLVRSMTRVMTRSELWGHTFGKESYSSEGDASNDDKFDPSRISHRAEKRCVISLRS